MGRPDPLAAVREAAAALNAAVTEAEDKVAEARREVAAAKAAVITKGEAAELVGRVLDDPTPRFDAAPILAGTYLEATRVRGALAALSPAQLAALLFRDQMAAFLMDRLDAEVERRGGWGRHTDAARHEAVRLAEGRLAALEEQRDRLLAEAEAVSGSFRGHRPAPEGTGPRVLVGEVELGCPNHRSRLPTAGITGPEE